MKKVYLAIFMAIFTLCLFSCSSYLNNEPKYTVWTDTTTYSNYYHTFNDTINDKCYMRYTILEEKFSDFAYAVNLTERNRLTEDEIYKWLRGHGFGSYEANEESSYIETTTDHVFYAIRNGETVYYLMK